MPARSARSCRARPWPVGLPPADLPARRPRRVDGQHVHRRRAEVRTPGRRKSRSSWRGRRWRPAARRRAGSAQSQRGPSHPGCPRLPAGASRRRCRVRRPARTCGWGQAKGLAESSCGSRADPGLARLGVLLRARSKRVTAGPSGPRSARSRPARRAAERVAEQERTATRSQPRSARSTRPAAPPARPSGSFQDVRGGRGPERAPPTALVAQQRGFLLRAGQRMRSPSRRCPVPHRPPRRGGAAISASRKGALSMRSPAFGEPSPRAAAARHPRSRAQWPATVQRPL